MIASENQAKAGIEKLIQFYQADPVAQKQAEGELEEMNRKIQDLVQSRDKVSSALGALSGTPAAVGGQDFAFEPNTPAEEVVKVRGLYDYEATCETELSFGEGDILTITEKDDSGWWFAELNGRSGFIPQNYVEEM